MSEGIYYCYEFLKKNQVFFQLILDQRTFAKSTHKSKEQKQGTMKITVSVIKADVGGIGGHTRPSDGLIEAVRDTIKNSGDLLNRSLHWILRGRCPHRHVPHARDRQPADSQDGMGCVHGRNTGSKRGRPVWRRTGSAKGLLLRKRKGNGPRSSRDGV